MPFKVNKNVMFNAIYLRYRVNIFDTQKKCVEYYTFKFLLSFFSISIIKTWPILVYLIWISTWRTFSIWVIIFYTVYIHFHAIREKAKISYLKEKHSNKSAGCIQIVTKEEFYNKQQSFSFQLVSIIWWKEKLTRIVSLTCLYPLLKIFLIIFFV